MKIHLEKAIFVNRAPFDKLVLDFSENEIAVLSAVNGRGKTTILSYIVDVFYEMARLHFPNEFKENINKLYRVSSGIYNLDQTQPSFVYLRFKTIEGIIDYIDIRNNCTEQQYNEAITIENKIPFDSIKSELENSDYVKNISSNFDKKNAEKIFYNNILTYFPSYRFEMPGYLNEPYKVKLDFKMQTGFSGYLKNPIEVVSGLSQLANWIMDIVIDLQYKKTSNVLIIKQNLDIIITQTVISKKFGLLRLGIGPRGSGGSRIQIGQDTIPNQPSTWKTIYPSIFNLSSGESAILCLFGELLRQADNNKNNIALDEITGIVLIDEIDKHLHIKLQKEILPKLFKLFPNVQFIVSSHSPFLSMGLAELVQERSKIIDLDNLGISNDPTTNELYAEVYNMMINENERFKERYQSLEQEIQSGTIPLIITEGKTDIQHIKKAKEKLNITDLDVALYEITEDLGDSKLKLLLEQSSKITQPRKIIGIFDRDIQKTISDIEKDNQSFKDYGNNVYAFCIPTPDNRNTYTNISIEFYYTDEELKTEKENKCLYFDNEIEQLFNKRTRKDEIRKLDTVDREKENEKKLFCENIGTEDWIHSKTRFADLVENDVNFSNNFDFSNFTLIFDKIRDIINPLQETINTVEEGNTDEAR